MPVVGRAVLVLGAGAIAAAGFICDASGSRPPPATVFAESGTVRVAPMSYCWGGLCVDAVLPAAKADEALPVRRGETLLLVTDALRHSLRQVGVAAWAAGGDGPSSKLSHERHGGRLTFGADLPSGLYLVDVFISLERGGDVSYVFALDVR